MSAVGTPTAAGTLRRSEYELGINGSKAISVGALPAPLNIAAGVLFRGEDYRIEQGELASYINGGAEAHTGADGRFSYARTLTGKADFDAYYSYENEFPYYIGGISDTLTVGVKQAPVRVTAAATLR